MRFLVFPLSLWLIVLGACSSPPKVDEVPVNMTPAAAKLQARHDFAVGKPKIYYAGGYAPSEPGIAGQERLVADLPRDNSFAGCTNPPYTAEFATAYNQEIVYLLQTRDAR